jgi:methylmalonyl-CoA mutase N-terminal domain/subunit
VAGSYVIEDLTNRIEAGARALIEWIDRMGGTLAAIEQGVIQRAIQDAAYQSQRAVDAGTSVVVGVNRFASSEPITIDLLRIDPEIERRQVERVRAVRASRSPSEWTRALETVARVAASSDNLMPAVIEAVEARATVGEISDTLRRVFGEYRETVMD